MWVTVAGVGPPPRAPIVRSLCENVSHMVAVQGHRCAVRRTLADRSTEGWFRSWSDISLRRPWASFCSFLCWMPCGVGGGRQEVAAGIGARPSPHGQPRTI